MFSLEVAARPGGIAALVGGLAFVGLGVVAAIDPAAVGNTWLVVGALAAALLVAAVLGLRTVARDIRVAPSALLVSAAALTLFGLSHFYALTGDESAFLLFSVFMIVGSIALIVAGVAVARADIWRGGRRFVPLLCGVWPIATIPAGAAIGDLPHFLAIAGWGVWWVALGAALLTTTTTAAAPAAGLAR